MGSEAAVTGLRVQAYTIPTDFPEADGTASWSSTTIIVVEAEAGGRHGFGYTYAHASIAPLIAETFADAVRGTRGLDPSAAWRAMQRAVRNLGREGLAATAISAVDAALWDLKAVLLGKPLASLLGRYRDSVPIYGSGGFTNYDDHQLSRQLATPLATVSAPRGLSPPCAYRGFCRFGCATNAKQSQLVTFIPRALRAGARSRRYAGTKARRPWPSPNIGTMRTARISPEAIAGWRKGRCRWNG